MTDDPVVLVAVDGSAEALEAVRWAAARAGGTGDRLHLLHVATPIELLPGLPVPGSLPSAVLMPNPADMAAQEKADLEMLESAAEFARGVDDTVHLTTERRTGGVGHVLVEASERASLVVLGCAGLAEGLGGLVRGSLVVHVSSHAACPTVAVGGRLGTGPVVVGVDGSRPSAAAARFAFAEAARARAPLHVVSSWALPVPLDPVEAAVMSDLGPERLRESGVRALDEVLEPLREANPEVEVHTEVTGDYPSHALVTRSAEASLVVVGSRGHGNLAGLLLGSTSRHVLAHASCPVAVVR